MNPAPEWLGALPYAEALRRQRERRAAVLAGAAPEAIWLLEHDPPVVTVGRRPAPGNPTPEALAAHGIQYMQTERGGLATWHGPGQLVAYFIVDAAGRKIGVRRMIARVEEGVICWLASQGVTAGRREGYPGVWVGRDKICALGFHFRRGVSMHGLALNLCPDLEAGFGRILPCGIEDGGVTSLERIGGQRVLPVEAWENFGACLEQKVFDGGGVVL